MINVPSKLFNRNINDVEAGMSDIHLYSEEEIEEAQVGYMIDNNGNSIKEWIGKNYVVVGIDSCNGDPIITDIDNEKLPVYTMFYDDWSTLQMITTNFEQFINILNKISKTDLSNETEKNELISNILDRVPDEGKDYWKSLIQVSYEFLNDID